MFFGSFLNVCIDRLPEKRSLALPRSHCENCKRTLDWFELIPVFSYLALRGKCRKCGIHIPFRIVVVEALTGSLFGYIAFKYGFGMEGIMLAAYTCILITVFFIDLEKMLILNSIVLPATVFALIFSIFLPNIGFLESVYGTLVATGIMLVVYFVSRGGMGEGDVKLAAFIGAANGFPLVLAGLFIAIVGSGILATFLLVTKMKKRRDAIPFGPFLATGALITMLWGEQIVDFYLDTLIR